MSIAKRAGAEFSEHSGWYLASCGSAVLAAAFPNLGIGFAGVALAFGLTVLTMAFAIGHISGCAAGRRSSRRRNLSSAVQRNSFG